MVKPTVMLAYSLILIMFAMLATCRDFEQLNKFDLNDPFDFFTDKLPLDGNHQIFNKVMPYVGNGHLATTIFDNAIFLNGLYNGERGESHRAHVPSIHNFSIVSPDPAGFSHTQYVLNMRDGVFFEQLEDSLVVIERRIYAHQYYTRLLITHIEVKRKNIDFSQSHQNDFKKKIVIKLDYQRNFSSVDFNLEPLVQQNEYAILRGKTKSVENPIFQKEPRQLVMYISEPQDIVIDENQDSVTSVFISSIDVSESPVKEEFDLAQSLVKSLKAVDLYNMHAARFRHLWESGRIETDMIELQKVIISCFYYIVSSLPALNHYGRLNPFYGLSPGTLSRGWLSRDYQGHSFWDTETWMYPPILMFYPEIAKSILSYRMNSPDTNSYNAKLFNTSGWRFGWESAFTGLDVTPDCCPEVSLYEIHNNGDIAYAARQYYSATRDNEWLSIQGGSELILKLAEFWSSRITYNRTKNQYEILNVLPPDEDAQPNVNNSIYTNIVASLAIHYANYVSCIMQKAPLDDQTVTKARCLHLPFDKQRQMHLEYEGYVNNVIKQADVVLLGYPLMWSMEPNIRRNDLEFYADKTRQSGPAMTWGIHSIGYIDLGDFEKAEFFLNKTYSLYFQKPFYIWTEERYAQGAVNFITGMGGFLQTVIFGYGGLRLHAEELIFNGNLPLLPGSTFLYLHGIKYLGAVINFNHSLDSIEIQVESMQSKHQLELVTPEKVLELKKGQRVQLAKVKFNYIIRAKDGTNCKLPFDKVDLDTCSENGKKKTFLDKVFSFFSSIALNFKKLFS